MSASPSGLDLLVTELAAKVAALTLEVHSLKRAGDGFRTAIAHKFC